MEFPNILRGFDFEVPLHIVLSNSKHNVKKFLDVK